MKITICNVLIAFLLLSCQPTIETNQLEDSALKVIPMDESNTSDDMIIVDSGDNALLGDLYVINLNDQNAQKLLDSGEMGYQHFGYADWSPDGSKIVFSALTPPWEIMTANADGSNLQTMPNTIGGQYPAWSPDGSKIAFSTWKDVSDIYVINMDGTELVNLTEDFPLNALDPSWSPDGAHLVFHAGESGDDFELFTIAINGLDTEQMTDNDVDDWSPSWSPNGKQIAFLHRSANDYNEINVIDLDTGNISQRTTEFGYPDLSADAGLCWMPDGKRLVMVSEGSVYVSRYEGGVIFEKIWKGKAFTSFPGCP